MNYNLDLAIPHKAPMRLIDRIVHVDEEHAITEALVTPGHIFYDTAVNGVYSWIGIEMMAQTAAVYVRGRTLTEKTPGVAFLMSVRQYTSIIPIFLSNSILRIRVYNTLLEEQVGAFDAEIFLEDTLVATAKLSAYRPTPEKLQHLLET